VHNVTQLTCVGVPAVSAGGPAWMQISMDGGKSWHEHPEKPGTRVVYVETVRVALDRRPYVHETSGAVLLRSDAVLALARGWDIKQSLDVSARLPAGGPEASWSWSGVAIGKDVVLPFELSGLPLNVHNDIVITVSYYQDASRIITKMRRFHRAAGNTSNPVAAEHVQVDHSRRGLLVSGKPWVGQGYYIGHGPGNSTDWDLDVLADIIRATMVTKGINWGMVYGLGPSASYAGHTPAKRTQFLDACAEMGFKVIYDLRVSNRTERRAQIQSVMHHPAILGNNYIT
jgi:hypothetical protein